MDESPLQPPAGPAAATPARPRSAFVDALAWIFIGLGGVAATIALLQNLMLYFLFPRVQMQAAVESSPAAAQMPFLARFLFGHMEWVFGAFFLLALLTLVAAIGLLRRWNWARVVLIGLMALAIVWNLGGVLLQTLLFPDFPLPANAPADFQASFHSLRLFIQAVSAVFAVVFSLLAAWIIWRLRSTAIVEEFGGRRRRLP